MPEEQGYKSPEVAQVLEESIVIEEFEQSRAWEIIQKLFKKEVVCIANAMLNQKNLTREKIVEYQIKAQIFTQFIPFLIARLKEEGDKVIEMLNEEGISLEDIF